MTASTVNRCCLLALGALSLAAAAPAAAGVNVFRSFDTLSYGDSALMEKQLYSTMDAMPVGQLVDYVDEVNKHGDKRNNGHAKNAKLGALIAEVTQVNRAKCLEGYDAAAQALLKATSARPMANMRPLLEEFKLIQLRLCKLTLASDVRQELYKFTRPEADRLTRLRKKIYAEYYAMKNNNKQAEGGGDSDDDDDDDDDLDDTDGGVASGDNNEAKLDKAQLELNHFKRLTQAKLPARSVATGLASYLRQWYPERSVAHMMAPEQTKKLYATLKTDVETGMCKKVLRRLEGLFGTYAQLSKDERDSLEPTVEKWMMNVVMCKNIRHDTPFLKHIQAQMRTQKIDEANRAKLAASAYNNLQVPY